MTSVRLGVFAASFSERLASQEYRRNASFQVAEKLKTVENGFCLSHVRADLQI